MSKQKLIAGILLGAAAGTLAMVYLKSSKGKKFVSKVKDKAEDASETVKDKVKSFESEIGDLLDKGKKFVEDLEDKAKTITKKAKKAF